jgi:hypothetical protein
MTSVESGRDNSRRPASMQRLSALASIVAVISFNVAASERASAQSGCIRQTMANQRYCGSEAVPLSRIVPDRPIGDFRAACATHDRCYASGGEQIVRLMEGRYRMSLLRVTPEQRREFRTEMQGMKAGCDITFREDMGAACRNVPSGRTRTACQTAANIYLLGVAAGASRAFNQAVDSSFTCRSR